ncbi:MAG: PhnD/SsuA/transferrin family substrate-binding protein [Propionibacteriales bacterium]|nr:PhnD/SsuA/transferrin family substrate-binding protein [Propionibacteriales bacterium]
MADVSRAPLKRFGLLAAAIGTVLSLTACASAPGSKSDEGGGDSSGPGVTIAGVFCVCFANVYLAYEQGFFEDEGVKVDELVTTKAGADTFQALATGDADFGLSGLDAIMRGREKGVEVQSVATVSPEFYALSVREQLADEIKEPGDLEGRKVGVSKVGSASWAFLGLLLEEAGLTHDDVKVVQLGGIDTMMAGLKKGTVDAAITWEPGTAQGEMQSFSNIVINSLDPADHEQIYGSDVSVSITLAVQEAFAKENAETVEGAIAALNKANEWIAAHTPEEVAEAIEPQTEGLDHELLVASIENTMATMPETVAVTETAYQDSAQRLEDAGIVKSIPPLDEIFDCDLAECSG